MPTAAFGNMILFFFGIAARRRVMEMPGKARAAAVPAVPVRKERRFRYVFLPISDLLKELRFLPVNYPIQDESQLECFFKFFSVFYQFFSVDLPFFFELERPLIVVFYRFRIQQLGEEIVGELIIPRAF